MLDIILGLNVTTCVGICEYPKHIVFNFKSLFTGRHRNQIYKVHMVLIVQDCVGIYSRTDKVHSFSYCKAGEVSCRLHY